MPDSPDNIVPITGDARDAAKEFVAEHDRELLTILFTDLVDSTRQQSELGNVEAARLTELHRKIVRDELACYDAREIEWAGDSCLAVFSKPSDAVVFALRMQAEHRRARETETRLPTVRVGMHLGEIVVKTGDTKTDLFGLQVSEAARVMSVAQGNQIFCTRAVFDNARGALKGNAIDGVGDVVWVNYGAYMLKGSEDPVELCEVGSSESAVLKAPSPNDKVAPLLPEGSGQYFPIIPATVMEAPKRRQLWPLIAIALVSIFLGAFAREFLPDSTGGLESAEDESNASMQVRRYVMELTIPPMGGSSLAISPDGSAIAYTTLSELDERNIALRRMDRLESEIISTENAYGFDFSPDGTAIAFRNSHTRNIRSQKIGGNSSTAIVDAFGGPGSVHWAKDDTLIFQASDYQGIHRVTAGGEPEKLTSLEDTPGATNHLSPWWLPDDSGLLFRVVGPGRSLVYASSPDGEFKELIEGEGSRYVDSGHLLYSTDDALMAAPFDLETLSIVGPTVSVTESRMTDPSVYDVSETGMLVYLSERTGANIGRTRTLVWVSLNGEETHIPAPPRPYRRARVSPDGRHIVTQYDFDVWLYDLNRSTLAQLTFSDGPDVNPIWSHDGDRITYAAAGFDLYAMPPTGDSDRMLLIGSPTNGIFPSSWSPDGTHLLYNELRVNTGYDLGMATFDESGPPVTRVVYQTPGVESGGVVSPDGAWVAYGSDESGTAHVYVKSFPSFEGKYLVSVEGGAEPLWAPDGSAIYYRNGAQMLRVEVTTDEDFSAGLPEVLWENDAYARKGPIEIQTRYDIHPDGDRFLMMKRLDNGAREAQYDLIVVENWFEELNRLAPHRAAN